MWTHITQSGSKLGQSINFGGSIPMERLITLNKEGEGVNLSKKKQNHTSRENYGS